eukprot:gb/GFBE01049410.1/.p1 GENE.gb/GFBE01049410.1/~~gb/GFBE01049410.1/.p1  ORF type:complete len:373 (+),score=93.66 gb/GFBE01049410.1/:1-1119(+)
MAVLRRSVGLAVVAAAGFAASRTETGQVASASVVAMLPDSVHEAYAAAEDQLTPHFERAAEATAPLRARIADAAEPWLEQGAKHLEQAWQTMLPLRERLTERCMEMGQRIVTAVEPVMIKAWNASLDRAEQLREASGELLARADEASLPLRARFYEVAAQAFVQAAVHLQRLRASLAKSGLPFWPTVAGAVLTAIIALALSLRCRRAQAVAESVEQVEECQVAEPTPRAEMTKQVASPQRVRRSEFALPPNVPLTRAAELLAAELVASAASSAPVAAPEVKEVTNLTKARRTSSPKPAFQLPVLSPESEAIFLETLNSWSQDQLMGIDGCGAASADKIVKYRTKQGPLRSMKDFEAVGIAKHISAKIITSFV